LGDKGRVGAMRIAVFEMDNVGTVTAGYDGIGWTI
jgi:hypothetical protein